MRTLLSCVFFVVTAAGCYTEVPLETPTPAAGTQVVVDLTDQGALDLAKDLGPAVDKLEGKIVTADESHLQVAVSSTQKKNGVESSWNGEQVTIQRSEIASLSQRKLSGGKTAALAGGLAAAVAGAAVVIGGATGGSSNGGGGTTGGQ